jgi:hypothetical protein
MTAFSHHESYSERRDIALLLGQDPTPPSLHTIQPYHHTRITHGPSASSVSTQTYPLTTYPQPPKRPRAAADTTSSSSKAQGSANRTRQPRRSSRTGLTSEQEAEARGAFGLFALHGLKGFEADDAGALRVADVRKVLVFVPPPDFATPLSIQRRPG